MELRRLRSFLAVAELLSFVRAARKLHLSQSALSAQIQKLEEDVNVQLFVRNRRKVELTVAGGIFIQEAKDTMARAENAVVRARKAALGEVGHLRIGFVSSAALELVPHIHVAFRKAFPDVNVELVNLQTSNQLVQLLDDTLDVGFLRMPFDPKVLAMTVIHREPFMMVLPKKHRLAAKPRLLLSDLHKEHFVAYGRHWAPGFFDHIMAMCLQAGFSPEIVQETAEMFTASALVGADLGVAIMPRSVVLAQTAGIVFRPIPTSVGIS